MTTKLERQGAILRLVEQRHLSTQSELAEALRGEGIDTVQATVSRDVAQLGLVKVRNGDGRLIYALPGAADLRRLEQLASALRNWAGAMIPTGQLLVIHTPRGFAIAARRRDRRRRPPGRRRHGRGRQHDLRRSSATARAQPSSRRELRQLPRRRRMSANGAG